MWKHTSYTFTYNANNFQPMPINAWQPEGSMGPTLPGSADYCIYRPYRAMARGERVQRNNCNTVIAFLLYHALTVIYVAFILM